MNFGYASHPIHVKHFAKGYFAEPHLHRKSRAVQMESQAMVRFRFSPVG